MSGRSFRNKLPPPVIIPLGPVPADCAAIGAAQINASIRWQMFPRRGREPSPQTPDWLLRSSLFPAPSGFSATLSLIFPCVPTRAELGAVISGWSPGGAGGDHLAR